MKHILAAALVALVATNIWSLFNQRRLERKLQIVQAENQKLSDEMTQRPAMSREEFRAAQTRLEQAHAFMDAVERRLTNATAVLGSLQQAAAQDQAVRSRRSGLEGGRAAAPEVTAPGGRPDRLDMVIGAPASSHSPDGQVMSRSWGPEQVLGPPNTHEAGDVPTAWAPLLSQGRGVEWLHLNYDRAVDISEINVRETYNPGAISKIAAVLPDGQEVVVWEGTEPAAPAPVDTNFQVPAGVAAQSVKVYLDRTRVAGWNEIDAVEVVGRDGSRQWASSASASSSFAEQPR